MCGGGRRADDGGRRGDGGGIQNQKQEPHTKMCGIIQDDPCKLSSYVFDVFVARCDGLSRVHCNKKRMGTVEEGEKTSKTRLNIRTKDEDSKHENFNT